MQRTKKSGVASEGRRRCERYCSEYWEECGVLEWGIKSVLDLPVGFYVIVTAAELLQSHLRYSEIELA